jgi:hypothetical protein
VSSALQFAHVAGSGGLKVRKSQNWQDSFPPFCVFIESGVGFVQLAMNLHITRSRSVFKQLDGDVFLRVLDHLDLVSVIAVGHCTKSTKGLLGEMVSFLLLQWLIL